MKSQSTLAKRTADSLEKTFKTQVFTFNKEANGCIEAIQQVIGILQRREKFYCLTNTQLVGGCVSMQCPNFMNVWFSQYI